MDLGDGERHDGLVWDDGEVDPLAGGGGRAPLVDGEVADAGQVGVRDAHGGGGELGRPFGDRGLDERTLDVVPAVRSEGGQDGVVEAPADRQQAGPRQDREQSVELDEPVGGEPARLFFVAAAV
ncbi:MAG: hypothetical protein J0H73_09975 [Salana multivorans]|nr:hypothetical protein [Salana multivorans]